MSKYDTTSTFPHQIDPPVFFSDIRLEHEVALGAYKELIAEKKYDEAIAYLEAHTEVDAYCSDLFNMLVNRTRAVQTYANGEYIPTGEGNNTNIISNIPSDSSLLNGNVISLSADDMSIDFSRIYQDINDSTICYSYAIAEGYTDSNDPGGYNNSRFLISIFPKAFLDANNISYDRTAGTKRLEGYNKDSNTYYATRMLFSVRTTPEYYYADLIYETLENEGIKVPSDYAAIGYIKSGPSFPNLDDSIKFVATT